MKDENVVVRIDNATQLQGFSSIEELNPPDLIEAEREPGHPATRIKKIVFGLPPGVEIDTQALLNIMNGTTPYHLIDARPVKTFGKAHIPGAKPAHPKDDNFLSLLPANKNTLLVFYCGGSSLPLYGRCGGPAAKTGYTNIKGCQAGLPGSDKVEAPGIHRSRLA